jgi:hypothetical protein
LKLETRDLVNPIYYRCRKHKKFVLQEGRFVACFPLNISIVHSLKLTVVTDNEHQTGFGFILGEIIHFRSLEFTADCFGCLSLSPEENDSCIIFMGI